jgi:S-disulfanyl-L-cysteine oxidoreductase SoxD
MNLSKLLFCFFLLALVTTAMAQEVFPKKYQLGVEAKADEILLWDTDIKPSGEGLPPGEGTVAQGEQIYLVKCMMCHGLGGKEGPYPTLVGRTNNDEFNFGNDHTLKRTVGNYWPYATTLFDYIWRAMPQLEPGSLTGDEVYSLSAYILHLNQIIPADGIMNSTTLPQIKMPARDKFYVEKK